MHTPIAPDQSEAKALNSDGFNIVWLQAGSCGGCSMALLGADDVGIEETLDVFNIRFLHHPALSLETGSEALELLDACAAGYIRVDALCVEGSILADRFQMRAGRGDEPFRKLVFDIAHQAEHVVAVGSCSSFGGIPAGGSNPTDAEGMQFTEDNPGGLLSEEFRSRSGLPVINISGCAPHPGWVVETLIALKLGTFTADDLDRYGRPKFYSESLAHHGCSRNEYYEFKASAEAFSHAGCMMEHLGCKATQAAGDCNQRVWSGGKGCTDAGYSCVACTQPGFEHPGHAFQETPKVAGIPMGLPRDMPKAWFVALAALSKQATPKRLRENAVRQHSLISLWPDKKSD